MKSVLFLAPDSVGIIKIVLEKLKHFEQIEVDFIDLDAYKNKFKYKNFYQKAYNAYLKNFKQRNIKLEHYNDLVIAQINSLKTSYDRIVIIRPDLLNDKALQLLQNKTKNFIAYYWDSTLFFPRKVTIAPYFKTVYSFDLDDCEKYNYHVLTNFYFFEDKPSLINNNVYCLISLDKRIAVVEKIAAYLNTKNIANTLKIFCHKKYESENIVIMKNVIAYEDMLKEISTSSVLLEVQKENQKGLTFRPFEALGLEKKLITNNENVKRYDFYNENNFFIFDENNINIPNSFFETPYTKIDYKIKQKYHINSWIRTLFID